MFLLYHSEGCNIFELVFHECYVNDLYTTTCSGMLGHHTLRCHVRQGRGRSRRCGKDTTRYFLPSASSFLLIFRQDT
jgi:hypothetical protein